MKESKKIEFKLVLNNTVVPTSVVLPYNTGMRRVVDSYMRPIPKNCCIVSDEIRQENRDVKLWRRTRNKHHTLYQPNIKSHFTIAIRTDKTHGCTSAAECYNNIRTGKCQDPFIIEHIGKLFFEREYGQKTK